MASTYYIHLAKQARQDLDDMADRDYKAYKRVERRLRRVLGEPGLAHLFRIVLRGEEASNWRTFDDGIEPYTAIFAFLTPTQRRKLGIRIDATGVAAIPHQANLDEVKERLIADADPDDSDWD